MNEPRTLCCRARSIARITRSGSVSPPPRWSATGTAWRLPTTPAAAVRALKRMRLSQVVDPALIAGHDLAPPTG
jgi:hypothetical protein